MDIEQKIKKFRFCPVCQKVLEINPIALMPACFLHGDVVVRNGEVYFKLVSNIV